MYSDYVNIKTVIDHLRAIPTLQPVITNTVTVSLAGTMLEIVFPDIPQLKEYVKRHEKPLRTELSGAFALDMRYTFAPYAMPFLPFPAGTSKHGNYILFLFPGHDAFSYAVVRKTKLFESFGSNLPAELYKKGSLAGDLSQQARHRNVEDIFAAMAGHLRETWRYMHPVFTFSDVEILEEDSRFIESVFLSIEKHRGIPDIRRFIGVPCFSFIDYKKFIENV